MTDDAKLLYVANVAYRCPSAPRLRGISGSYSPHTPHTHAPVIGRQGGYITKNFDTDNILITNQTCMVERLFVPWTNGQWSKRYGNTFANRYACMCRNASSRADEFCLPDKVTILPFIPKGPTHQHADRYKLGGPVVGKYPQDIGKGRVTAVT